MEVIMTKIMLVEDDKSLREIYGVRLLAEGYEIISAGDGEEALAMAVKEKPDLILSDVMMPKISGFDMLDILRATPETKNIKVIMMTALSSEDQRSRGEKLGADRYLVKSQVGIEDVVRTIHDLLADTPAAQKPKNVFEVPAESAAIKPALAPAEPAPSTPPAPDVSPVETAPVEVAPVATAVETAPVEPVTPAPVVEAPVATSPVEEPTGSVAPEAAVAAPAPVAIPVTSESTPQPPVAAAPVPEPQPVVSQPSPQPQPTDEALRIGPAGVPEPDSIKPKFEPNFVRTPEYDPEPAVPAPAFSPSENVAPIDTDKPAPVTATQSIELPQPTAPFSTPAPASLGDRVINPINPVGPDPNLSAKMEQELSANTSPTPPVPPAAPPQQ